MPKNVSDVSWELDSHTSRPFIVIRAYGHQPSIEILPAPLHRRCLVEVTGGLHAAVLFVDRNHVGMKPHHSQPSDSCRRDLDKFSTAGRARSKQPLANSS